MLLSQSELKGKNESFDLNAKNTISFSVEYISSNRLKK